MLHCWQVKSAQKPIRKSATTYHHGNLKESLVALALEHLSNGERPVDLSVRTLAAELGVSQGAPYRHFPNSEALIAAVAARGFEMLADALARLAPDAPASAGQRLESLGISYVQFAGDNPQLYRTMFYFPRESLGRYPDLQASAGRAYEILGSSIRAYHKARGGGRLDAEEATLAAWAYVHGLADLTVNQLAAGNGKLDMGRLTRLAAGLTRGL